MISLFEGDCLEIMQTLPAASVDLVLCDLPYGTTQNKWDAVIPFYKIWSNYQRVGKEQTAVVLNAAQPFTSVMINSNLADFKYAWVWDKVNKFSGHLNCKKQPMRITEDIAVFYKKQPTYNPQMTQGRPYRAVSSGAKSSNYGTQKDQVVTVSDGMLYPRNLVSIAGDERGTEGRIHPTQKPVALMEYLIRTYTNEGDTVLDNCMGSGTTGVACLRTNRNFIGIEKDPEYFKIAVKRMQDEAPFESFEINHAKDSE